MVIGLKYYFSLLLEKFPRCSYLATRFRDYWTSYISTGVISHIGLYTLQLRFVPHIYLCLIFVKITFINEASQFTFNVVCSLSDSLLKPL